MWVCSLSREDPLKEKMAAHSSIFSRIIPWTGEPDRLQSMGMQKNLDMTEVTGCTCVHAYLNLLAVAYVTKIIFFFGLVFNSDAFW